MKKAGIVFAALTVLIFSACSAQTKGFESDKWTGQQKDCANVVEQSDVDGQGDYLYYINRSQLETQVMEYDTRTKVSVPVYAQQLDQGSGDAGSGICQLSVLGRYLVFNSEKGKVTQNARLNTTGLYLCALDHPETVDTLTSLTYSVGDDLTASQGIASVCSADNRVFYLKGGELGALYCYDLQKKTEKKLSDTALSYAVSKNCIYEISDATSYRLEKMNLDGSGKRTCLADPVIAYAACGGTIYYTKKGALYMPADNCVYAADASGGIQKIFTNNLPVIKLYVLSEDRIACVGYDKEKDAVNAFSIKKDADGTWHKDFVYGNSLIEVAGSTVVLNENDRRYWFDGSNRKIELK